MDLHIGQMMTAATAGRWHRADSGVGHSDRPDRLGPLSEPTRRVRRLRIPGLPTHLVGEAGYLRQHLSVESPAMRSSDRDLDPTAWGHHRGFATEVCDA
jgi:hypothetical protein